MPLAIVMMKGGMLSQITPTALSAPAQAQTRRTAGINAPFRAERPVPVGREDAAQRDHRGDRQIEAADQDDKALTESHNDQERRERDDRVEPDPTIRAPGSRIETPRMRRIARAKMAAVLIVSERMRPVRRVSADGCKAADCRALVTCALRSKRGAR